jgi:hypothetical protein
MEKMEKHPTGLKAKVGSSKHDSKSHKKPAHHEKMSHTKAKNSPRHHEK